MQSSKQSLYKELIVKEIVQEVKDFKVFVFEDQVAKTINYLAGQYLTLIGNFENEEIRRSYSIPSAPILKEPLSVGVKRIPNGIFSRYLVERVKPDDKILTIGASGFFIFPDDIYKYSKIFFLAAGSGITPIYSLLKTALFQFPHLSVVLIYSNHSPDKTIFLDALRQLQQQFSQRFLVEFLFSINQDLSKAHLNKKLLGSLLGIYHTYSFDKTLFYICGPEAYMRMCTYVLQEADVPKENIMKENFNTGRRPFKLEPPDKNARHVYMKFKGEHIDLQVKYPDSILAAAKKRKIVLPYSCEVGRCGTCTMQCTKGTVWMSNNEVLTDKDLEKGFVLTCVGHPVYGDVVLKEYEP